jgi:GTPase SAR1 family protein
MINSLDKPSSNNSNGAKNNNSSQDINQNTNFLEKRIMRFKVILIGDAAVGKTSILQRFIHNKFKLEYNCTIGVDYWVKSLSIDNENTVDLQIWDTCGQERYKTITRQYYRDTHGKN